MEEQWVYSTSIKDNRYTIQCIAVFDKIRAAKFIVDTGAKFTCCTYKAFNKKMQEHELCRCEIKWIGGFIKDASVKFYKCRIKQFTIGTIDMEEQDIWITFDKRVTDNVLGMDILKQVIMITNPYEQKIYFCKDAEDYERNFQLRAR